MDFVAKPNIAASLWAHFGLKQNEKGEHSNVPILQTED